MPEQPCKWVYSSSQCDENKTAGAGGKKKKECTEEVVQSMCGALIAHVRMCKNGLCVVTRSHSTAACATLSQEKMNKGIRVFNESV